MSCRKDKDHKNKEKCLVAYSHSQEIEINKEYLNKLRGYISPPPSPQESAKLAIEIYIVHNKKNKKPTGVIKDDLNFFRLWLKSNSLNDNYKKDIKKGKCWPYEK